MTNSMTTARAKAVAIHTNCLPLLVAKSNMDAGSADCTDAYMLIQPMNTSSR